MIYLLYTYILIHIDLYIDLYSHTTSTRPEAREARDRSSAIASSRESLPIVWLSLSMRPLGMLPQRSTGAAPGRSSLRSN